MPFLYYVMSFIILKHTERSRNTSVQPSHSIVPVLVVVPLVPLVSSQTPDLLSFSLILNISRSLSSCRSTNFLLYLRMVHVPTTSATASCLLVFSTFAILRTINFLVTDLMALIASSFEGRLAVILAFAP